MLKSFFNKKDKIKKVESTNISKTQQADFEYGLSERNPILVESINAF